MSEEKKTEEVKEARKLTEEEPEKVSDGRKIAAVEIYFDLPIAFQ